MAIADTTTANELALRDFDEAQARADEHLEARLVAQKKQGVSAVDYYAQDIAANRDFLGDCAANVEQSGALADLLHLATHDSITAGIYLSLMAKAVIRDRALAEEIESDGLYEPIDRDLTMGKAIDNINAAIAEIKNRSK